MEFLIPVVVTKSEISPLHIVIPGILNSGGGKIVSYTVASGWCTRLRLWARPTGEARKASALGGPLARQRDRVLLLDRQMLLLLDRADGLLDDHLQAHVAEGRRHLSQQTPGTRGEQIRNSNQAERQSASVKGGCCKMATRSPFLQLA